MFSIFLKNDTRQGKEITCLWPLSAFKFSLLTQISFPDFGRAKIGARESLPSFRQVRILGIGLELAWNGGSGREYVWTPLLSGAFACLFVCFSFI